MFSQSRQMDGCEDRVGEEVVGTKGTSNCHNVVRVNGQEAWRFEQRDINAYRQEHLNLINSIREGKPINEARAIAESTMTGIIGRESVYSGQVISWDTAIQSTQALGPSKYEFGDLPFPEVPMPGKYKPL